MHLKSHSNTNVARSTDGHGVQVIGGCKQRIEWTTRTELSEASEIY